MDWAEVSRRIAAGEDAHTELGRLRAFHEEDWQEAVGAFANTEGGLVVLGVRDDGGLDGVPMDPDEVQERLSQGLQSALSAPVPARLGRHLSPAGWVHWIEVFDDRVVVTSPGALPNPKRPASVLAGGTPRSRNEAMASTLLDLGLMEQRGTGFPRMIREMRAFNGSEPQLETDREERWVRVTLWR